MSGDFQSQNPYASSRSGTPSRSRPPGNVKGKVMAPAIALIVVGSLGLLGTFLNIFIALTGQPPPVDPNAPPFMQGFAQGQFGPTAGYCPMLFFGPERHGHFWCRPNVAFSVRGAWR